jgi:hypothetical protein
METWWGVERWDMGDGAWFLSSGLSATAKVGSPSYGIAKLTRGGWSRNVFIVCRLQGHQKTSHKLTFPSFAPAATQCFI